MNLDIETIESFKVLDLEGKSIPDFIKTEEEEQLKERIVNASYYIDYKINKAKKDLNLLDNDIRQHL